jgi:TPR repeat protein
MSGNHEQCAFCKAERKGRTEEKEVKEMLKRVEAKDASAMYHLARYYQRDGGLLQDRPKALELYARAAQLGSCRAHFSLGTEYDRGGDLKKARFHYGAAAMAGHEAARYNLGYIKRKSGNVVRAMKHMRIAAYAGCYNGMNAIIVALRQRMVSRDEVDSIMTAYNNSCAEMRSEAKDKLIRMFTASS